MMKQHIVLGFVSALALSAVLADKAEAVDPTGDAFCENGIGDRDQFVRRVARSLELDPTGNRVVEGCIATPLDFFNGFKAEDPRADNLNSVGDLPAYLRSLVVATIDRGTQYVSACLQVRNGRRVVVRNCVTRHVREGEVVYENPRTRVRVLFSSCANPGGQEEPPIQVVAQQPCIRVIFPSMGRGTRIRIAYMGPTPLPGRCHSLDLAGRAPLSDYPEECPDREQRTIGGRQYTIVCSWDAVEEAVEGHLRVNVEPFITASFVARADGQNVWHLPPEALNGEAVVCWELEDGTLVFATLGARRPHYVNGVATMTVEHVRQAQASQR